MSRVKITLFTHLQAILGAYDFLLSDEYNQHYIKKSVLALPSFIMAVNGCLFSSPIEVQ